MDVLLVAALAMVLLLPSVAAGVNRTFDPFAPIVLFALAYGAMFVARPAAIMARNEYSFALTGSAVFDFRAGFTAMLVIALIGGLGFVFGYLSPVGGWSAARLRPPPSRYNPDVATLIAAIIALLGVLAFAMLLTFGGGIEALGVFLSGRSTDLTQLLASSSKYLLQGQIVLIPSSLILLALGTAHRNIAALAAGAVAMAALLLVAVPTGNRIVLLPMIISIAVYYYLTRQRRPSALVLLVAIVLLLALATLIGTVREADYRRTISLKTSVVQLVHQPTTIFETVTHNNEAAEAPGIAAVLSLPPEAIDKWQGTALLADLATRPVPRAIWAGKPDPPRQLAAEALFGRHAALFVYRPAFSVVLEPYLDGGLLGVFVLMVGYGIAARVLYEYTRLNSDSLIARLLFALLIPAVIAGVRDDLVATLSRLTFLLVPIGIIFGIAASFPRSRHPGDGAR